MFLRKGSNVGCARSKRLQRCCNVAAPAGTLCAFFGRVPGTCANMVIFLLLICLSCLFLSRERAEFGSCRVLSGKPVHRNTSTLEPQVGFSAAAVFTFSVCFILIGY